jgi:hypothetical protein
MAILLSGPLPAFESAWDIILIPIVLGLCVTIFAFPFAAGALILLGIPLALVLQHWAARWWVGLLATALGGLAGFALTCLLGFEPQYRSGGLLGSMGFAFGAPTGLLWFMFARRRLIDRRKEKDQCTA